MYDVKKLSITIDGRIATGYAEGNVVEIEQMEDGVVEYIGADGETEVAISSDKRADMTLRLKSTSPTIRQLNRLANRKESFAVSVVDFNDDGTNASATECYVRRPVFPPKGREITEAEFTILMVDPDIQ